MRFRHLTVALQQTCEATRGLFERSLTEQWNPPCNMRGS
jgi:hypothetical protein